MIIYHFINCVQSMINKYKLFALTVVTADCCCWLTFVAIAQNYTPTYIKKYITWKITPSLQN